jgi:hypothetical protein
MVLQTQHLIEEIFSIDNNFEEVVAKVFSYQYLNNSTYKKWIDYLNKPKEGKLEVTDIPFLPISFFKSHTVKAGSFIEEITFESSGTTTTQNAKHFVKDADIYRKSFFKTFEQEYGRAEEWCIIGLLPSYLERNNSSLVFMIDELIRKSKHSLSNFYLNDFDTLHKTLQQLEAVKQKTLLIGVTFALLDFAERFPMPLKHTIIMETGGMKGRKKEMTKDEVHSFLQKQFSVAQIHSEYGMTELLSQAYSKANQIHTCPPFMKVLVRQEGDPMQVSKTGKGVINVIDLANLHSCSFIATDDVGEVFEDGSFKIYGRLDTSDLRGCSLLYI